MNFAVQEIVQPILLHTPAQTTPIPASLTQPPEAPVHPLFAAHPSPTLPATVVDHLPSGHATLATQEIRFEITLPPQSDLAIGDRILIEPAPEAILRGTLQLLPPPVLPTATATDPRFDLALRQAGLTPSPATREAAAALAHEHLPIQRTHVQTLLAMAAGHTGSARSDMLAASARLLALDAPVSPPLAAGIAQRDMTGASSPASLLRHAIDLLGQVRTAATPAPSAADPSAAPVPPPNTGNATPAGSSGTPPSPDSAAPAPSSPPPPAPVMTGTTAAPVPSPPPAGGDTAPPTASSPLSVTLPLDNAVRNLQAIAVLLETPDTAAQLSAFTSSFGRDALAYAASQIETAAAHCLQQSPVLQNLDAAISHLLDASAPQSAQPAPSPTPGTMNAIPTPPGGADASGLASLPYPGVEPGSGQEWVLPPPERGAWVDQARVETILRDILSAPTPEAAARRVTEAERELDRQSLRALGQRLEEEESARIGQDTALRTLRDAAGDIRDLGRRFLAMKAEALATLRQDSPMFVADVPIRFRDEDHDSRLRMFYRKGGGRKKDRDWDQRVLLDLDLSRLGTVMGDLRFAGGVLSVRILAQDGDAATHLQEGADMLVDALREKGFPCQPTFGVLPTLPLEPPLPDTGAAPPSPSPSADPDGNRQAPRPPLPRIDTRA